MPDLVQRVEDRGRGFVASRRGLYVRFHVLLARQRRELEPLGGGSDRQFSACNCLDVVPAQLEVGDSVDSPELDRRYVVRFGRFLLRR